MMQSTPLARHHAAAIAVMLVAAVLVFGQSINDEFISYDDGQYIFNNPHVTDGLIRTNIRWALTDTSIANWHPVTMLSHIAVAATFGLEPSAHHAVNLVLHLANCVLLYAVLFRMTGAFWPSLLATLLFAVHPLRVESVAWVSERKGLLCAFFGLLTLLVYERYARAPSAWKYVLVFIAFALGLLSKPALLALPFALLLLDYWPLNRFEFTPRLDMRGFALLIEEKLPLLAASIAVTIVTYIAQSGSGTVQTLENYPLSIRAANAVVSYGMYLANTFVPVHLTLHYPHPKGLVFHEPALYVSLAVLVVTTLFALWMRRSRPWLVVGWFWFLGLLVPAIGLVQLADQARADRYTYLPQIGVLFIVAWGLDEFRRRVPSASHGVTAFAAAAVTAFCVLAFVQTAHWKDDFTLYTYAVERAPSSALAHQGLGIAYLKRGDIASAEASFLDAIQRDPPVYQAYSNLGAIEIRRGNFARAADYFASALAIKPSQPDLMVNLGIALYNLGQTAKAAELAESALSLDPAHARALELRERSLSQAP